MNDEHYPALAWLRDEMDCHGSEIPGVDTVAGILRELEDRQDADGDSEGYHPNSEMQIIGDFNRRFGTPHAMEARDRGHAANAADAKTSSNALVPGSFTTLTAVLTVARVLPATFDTECMRTGRSR